MTHLLGILTKYLMIILTMIYTFECFYVFKGQNDHEKQNNIYIIQRIIIFLYHFLGFTALYILNMDKKILGFYLIQLVLLFAIVFIYLFFYKGVSDLVLNNMLFLLSTGFIILTRLSFDKAFKQFMFIAVGFVIAIVIPLILSKSNGSRFRNFQWIYSSVGIIALLIVLIVGRTSYGAKLSIVIFGIAIQPSEFVKILFVFFIAAMMRKNVNKKKFIITSAVSAIFVLILVASKDLGGALLYFFTYLVMVYVATRKTYIFVGGLGCMCVAAFAGYKIFSHVQTRVIAWLNPISVIDNQGYQVSQSLFGIGTGGWLGLGLGQGMPKKIPVVENDFIFAAISEEMGGLVAICIIMICVSCFLMIFNISMQLKDPFYKLVALGLGTTYTLQVLLTIGGVIKFIPSTGVTLPLVSYGGSSMLSTMMVFGIIQALYIMQNSGATNIEKN